MSTERLFEGFDADRQARYEAELVERYGDEIRPDIDESRRRVAGFDDAKQRRLEDEWTSICARLVTLIEAGAGVDDPEVQAVIGEHHRWITNYWTPDRDSYPGLGRLYVDSPDFKARFDAQHPRLAEFLRDAITAYAQASL